MPPAKVLLAALLIVPGPAIAATDAYCLPFARGALANMVGTMPAADQRKTTFPILRDWLFQLRAKCALAEEDSSEADNVWLLALYDAVHVPAASVPADGPEVRITPVAPDRPPEPPPKPAATAAAGPAAVCARAHMRVVVHGKGWRCAK